MPPITVITKTTAVDRNVIANGNDRPLSHFNKLSALPAIHYTVH